MDVIVTKAGSQAYRDNWDRIFGKKESESEASIPEPAPTKNQYFYRMNECKALDANSPDCICWHDEGTGPCPDSDPVDGYSLRWRVAGVSVEVGWFGCLSDLTVPVNYAGDGPQYPGLPTPDLLIDGKPYWGRDQVINYGKAVDRCKPSVEKT